MVKKANINWTAKQLGKMVEKGTIVFDNAVQRSFCWDNDKKSLLIHSMITGYPVPPFYSAKDGESVYSMLDGKQRTNTIADYQNDGFELTNVPEVTLESGETIDINGKIFSQLPEEIQDEIKDYSLSIYYFDGITDDEVAEMFFRLNNGKALSPIELTRVKAKSFDTIVKIGKHDLFTSALTEKALNKYANEDLVIKSWALLNTENPSFETKFIRPLMEAADITEEQAADITAVYDRILETHNAIVTPVEDDKANKLNKKIAKRVVTRTHLLSLVPVALQSIKDNVELAIFTDFAKSFFSGKRSASTSEQYNIAAGAGSAKSENVRKRINAIHAAYNAYLMERKNQPITAIIGGDIAKKAMESMNMENIEYVDDSVITDTYEGNDDVQDLPSNVLNAYSGTRADW